MRLYIVKIQDKQEYRLESLKAARDLVRSLLNINEVKGISETIEIFKEVTRRKKIDEVTSKADNVGSAEKVFNF